MAKKIEIKVSKKILADVSRGIYRSPANALKELVSNAFDACATHVNITTNAPYYDVFTCIDNGYGINLGEFKKIIGGIGSSGKREGTATSIVCRNFERPIIGKIGIGLLAVGQVCDRFTIVSKKKGESRAFSAIVDLRQFDKDKAYLKGERGIVLGHCVAEEFEVSGEEEEDSYTKVIMDYIKPGFQGKLKQEDTFRITRPRTFKTVRDFEELVISLSEQKDFKGVYEYDKMVWELGTLCPVEYIVKPGMIFPTSAYLKPDINRLKGYSFEVYIDGLKLYKPLLFPVSSLISNEGDDYRVYKLPVFDKKIDGETLKFHGYIYSQRVKLKPTEIQGLSIRIKDVAIGPYDKTFLKYPREEGPIFSLMTGEFFVDEGLENALNIDRNSFNETHPHFRALQRYLYEFLKNVVVNDIRKRSKTRRAKEVKVQTDSEIVAYCDQIKSEFSLNLKTVIKETETDPSFAFDKRSGLLTINTNAYGWSKAVKERTYQIKTVIGIIAICRLKNIDIPDQLINNLILKTK